jgi:hypothetical protein
MVKAFDNTRAHSASLCPRDQAVTSYLYRKATLAFCNTYPLVGLLWAAGDSVSMAWFHFHLRHISHRGADPFTTLSSTQVTVIQGDAADDKTVQDLVSHAIKEEGRLDVFFANVSSHYYSHPQPPHIHN